MKHKYILSYLLAAVLALVITGCSSQESPEPRESEALLDKTRVHTQKGDEYLKAEKYKAAADSYTKALGLDPENAVALSGKSLALVMDAKEQAGASEIEPNTLKGSLGLQEKAEDLAETDEAKNAVYVNKIRQLTALKTPSEWHEEAEDYYSNGMDLENPDSERLNFYMAMADSEALNFSGAAEKFQTVLEINGEYAHEADKKIEILNRIQRAKPVTKFGKDVAFSPGLTRADVATLFLIELKLEDLYNSRKQKNPSAFSIPGNQVRLKIKENTVQPAIDISGHALEAFITEALTMGIRGLEADSNRLFYPDKTITRAEFAVMIEDILTRVLPDPTLPTKYIGEKSNFDDVRNDVWYFNAARVVTERQLMEIGDKLTGSFKPLERVSGADALLAIRELKQGL